VGAEIRSAAVDVLLRGRTAVAGRCDAVACQRVEVDEVLLRAAVEVDVGVATAGRVHYSGDGARWRILSDRAEGVAAVDRGGPDAALRAGPGRPADEHAAQRVDADVRLAE